MSRLLNRPLISDVQAHIVSYPTPTNLSYIWNFGVLSGICLVVQLVTGIVLAIHYSGHVDYAFQSVEHIIRDVNNGWILRYVHANGARIFFIAVYIHIFRGLYFASYRRPRILVWTLGVVLILLIIATAFIGYVLPWGQISFWGATVITNLFSAFPVVGPPLVEWLWGGFAVDNATLNRFFRLHYLLPFAIAAVRLLHLLVLHQHGSRNPLGIVANTEKTTFYPYFYIKDLFGLVAFIVFFSAFVFFRPNYLGHPDNYIPANPIVTPAAIVPEWYFLPYYAILRAIPDKLLGVLALFAAVLIFAFIPYITTTRITSANFRPAYRIGFWFFLVIWGILVWLGGEHVEEPYVTLSQVFTVLYFSYFLLFLPLVGKIEEVLEIKRLD